MTFHVYLIDSIGTAESADSFDTRKEAQDAADWWMGLRDWSQVLDGTTYEIREESDAE
jgi:hypothetical protein